MNQPDWKAVAGLTLLTLSAFCVGVFGASVLNPHTVLEAEPSPVVAVRIADPVPEVEEEATTPAPDAPTATEHGTDLTPTGLSVPSLGISVPLGAVAVENGEITPPTFDTAYVVDGYSVGLAEANTGSIIVVFHSQRDGNGIGNKFFHQSDGSPAVAPGSQITLEGLGYQVQGTEAVSKEELPTRTDIWQNDPGTLVLITCLQNPDGSPSTHNFVITAKLSEPTSED